MTKLSLKGHLYLQHLLESARAGDFVVDPRPTYLYTTYCVAPSGTTICVFDDMTLVEHIEHCIANPDVFDYGDTKWVGTRGTSIRLDNAEYFE